MPEHSTYDEGVDAGRSDRQRLDSVSEETKAQILARYSYAVQHVLDYPYQAGYVAGYNAADVPGRWLDARRA